MKDEPVTQLGDISRELSNLNGRLDSVANRLGKKLDKIHYGRKLIIVSIFVNILIFLFDLFNK